MFGIFAPTDPERVRSTQAREAERLYLEHLAAAEMHAAHAEVYRKRVEFLRSYKVLTSEPKAEPQEVYPTVAPSGVRLI
jgi:hypothetical protein